MIARHRRQALWAWFLVHRISGVLLAVFLPLHFLVLSQALLDPAALDGFLQWNERPAVKIAETGLVFTLAVHLTGGLRLLALELLPYRDWQKTAAALAAMAALLVACGYLLNLA